MISAFHVLRSDFDAARPMGSRVSGDGGEMVNDHKGHLARLTAVAAGLATTVAAVGVAATGAGAGAEGAVRPAAAPAPSAAAVSVLASAHHTRRVQAPDAFQTYYQEIGQVRGAASVAPLHHILRDLN
jgi:hypothetical protein